jgi:hypothetical protein
MRRLLYISGEGKQKLSDLARFSFKRGRLDIGLVAEGLSLMIGRLESLSVVGYHQVMHLRKTRIAPLGGLWRFVVEAFL